MHNASSRSDSGAKPLLYDTAFLEPTAVNVKQVALLYLESVFAVYTSISGIEYLAGTFSESDSYATMCKSQALPKSIVKQSSGTRRENELVVPWRRWCSGIS